ncbi:cell envelope integrity protein TolA [Hydrogenophaga sp.]|uniref:cell envelope integrity protein TolA n=1 Tax=Hydrogenophaga sp. TaxID=1904254 RepID=UPI002725647E|nr:cell envelope integrity protein TolA [Hydrogenophaga sp.]MDO9434331.1 cell envelope integrity protein TolA [Hydrogenophaga sp.]
MQTTADHLDLAPPQSGRWLGPVGLALIAHGILIIALTFGVQWQSDGEPVTVEAELWSRTPQQAAPRAVEPPPPPPQSAPAPTPAPAPKPAPAPTPAPPPPGPTQAEIATAQAKKKAEAEKKEREEEAKKVAAAKAADKAAAEKKAAADKAAAEKEKQQKLAAEKREQDRKQAANEKRDQERKDAEDTKRMAQLREDQMKRMMGQAGATGGAQSTGTAQQSSGPTPGYAGRVAARIRPNVVFTDVAPGNPRAEVEVRISPDGTISSSKLVKSSGNKDWDDAVLRAIERTSTLPKDTNGTVPSSMVIGLRPLD